MRNIITLLTILTLLSCDNNKTTSEYKLSSPTNSTLQTTEELIGEWGIYVTGNDKMRLNCNSCPRITFKTNNTATIMFPNGATEDIQWTRENKRITIKNVSTDNNERQFSNGDYSMTFETQDDSMELTLTKSKTSDFYILRHESNRR